MEDELQIAACPILLRMREVAMSHLHKRDRLTIERIGLAGTRNQALEMRRAQIFLEAFHPGATIDPHPGGALSALQVAAVPYIWRPTAMPPTSAARRKFFLTTLAKAITPL